MFDEPDKGTSSRVLAKTTPTRYREVAGVSQASITILIAGAIEGLSASRSKFIVLFYFSYLMFAGPEHGLAALLLQPSDS